MQNVMLVVLAQFLVALNGCFVAAEFGIVRLRKTRVRAIAKTQTSIQAKARRAPAAASKCSATCWEKAT